MSFNLADCFDLVASTCPEREALIQGARRLTWQAVELHLTGYKAPKHVVQVDDVYRSPSGKADFKRTRAVAMAALGIAA